MRNGSLANLYYRLLIKNQWIIKQFEINAIGLEELSIKDAAELNGGFAWVVFGIAVVAGLLLACPTAAQNQETTEEDEVDAITGA